MMGALRLLAIAIAVLGVVDPALTIDRRVKPLVSIVAADRDPALAAQVARALQEDFELVHAPFSAAAARVIVGPALPAVQGTAPAFAVIPPRALLAVTHVQAPTTAQLEARVPVIATIDLARRVRLTTVLRSGPRVVDRRIETAGPGPHAVALSFVPAAAGPTHLRVEATAAGRAPARADLVVDVRPHARRVLFYDARPAWMSTFVRRALADDPRFALSSRVITSRSVSNSTGAAPSSLADPTELHRFDVIVVGAPELLASMEVSGLDQFLRRRGGSVILLLDRPDADYSRLTAVSEWRSRSAPVEIGGGLRATRVIWPARLPPGAQAVARDAGERPVLWRTGLGAGQLIVSGALDAWRYRGEPHRFAEFWRGILAEAAEASAPIDVQLEQRVLTPGARTSVTVTLRDAALGVQPHAELSARMNDEVVRLWPVASAGQFRGRLSAPARPGTYQLAVRSADDSAQAALVVADSVRPPAPRPNAALDAYVNARGGASFQAGQLDELRAALQRATDPTVRRERGQPMRSAWWIIPFALLLSAEWWWRRRRGLA